MIGPSWVAHPNRIDVENSLDQFARKSQRNGPTGRLSRCDLGVGVLAKDQFSNGCVVISSSIDRQVALAASGIQQNLLGLPNGFHDGRGTGFVSINSDRQIDFVWVGVLLELLHQAKDCVRWVQWSGFEHG